MPVILEARESSTLSPMSKGRCHLVSSNLLQHSGGCLQQYNMPATASSVWLFAPPTCCKCTCQQLVLLQLYSLSSLHHHSYMSCKLELGVQHGGDKGNL